MKKLIVTLFAIMVSVFAINLSYAEDMVPKEAATPVIVEQPADITGYVDSEAILSVSAIVTDEGELSYQWFSNLAFSYEGGVAIEGATENTYSPPTDETGTICYYVVVTNTLADPAEPGEAAEAVEGEEAEEAVEGEEADEGVEGEEAEEAVEGEEADESEEAEEAVEPAERYPLRAISYLCRYWKKSLFPHSKHSMLRRLLLCL